MRSHDDDLETLSDEDWCTQREPSGVVAAIVGIVVLGLLVAALVVAGILSLSINGR